MECRVKVCRYCGRVRGWHEWQCPAIELEVPVLWPWDVASEGGEGVAVITKLPEVE